MGQLGVILLFVMASSKVPWVKTTRPETNSRGERLLRGRVLSALLGRALTPPTGRAVAGTESSPRRISGRCGRVPTLETG